MLVELNLPSFDDFMPSNVLVSVADVLLVTTV
jgi:predicted component of type VI protein secretion system